jgi:hypothetical protein
LPAHRARLIHDNFHGRFGGMGLDKVEGQDRLRSISTPSKLAGKRPGTSLAAGRWLPLFLALLLALSNALYGGGGHAHAAAGGESRVSMNFSPLHDPAGSLDEADVAPCENGNGQVTGQDGCCMTAPACGTCAPVPAIDLVFVGGSEPAASTPPSPSLPGETRLGLRPPQLSPAA